MRIIATLETILQQLHGVRPQRDGSWIARCPAHDDREPSLHVSLTEDRILLHCFAGCSVDSICRALGITTADLFLRNGHHEPEPPEGLTLTQFALVKRLSEEHLRQCGVSQTEWQARPAVAFAYVDVDGNQQAVRYRTALTGNRFRWHNGAKPKSLLYGAWWLPLWREKEVTPVLLVEGESDCLTLWQAGIPAVGVAGADCLSEENASLLDGLQVVLWKEPDAGGQKLLESAIPLFGDRLRVIDPPEGIKDPSDLWLRIAREEQDAHTARRRFKEQVQHLIQTAKPNLAYIPLPVPGQVSAGVYLTVADILAMPEEQEQSLPLLGSVPDYFAKGRSHLLAGEPKAGKSELVWQSLLHWTEERVLVVTEEPSAELKERFLRLHLTPDSAPHVTIVTAREEGMEPHQILQVLRDPQFTVLVVDTVRNLFAPLIRDENDNAQVAQVMTKILSAAAGRTVILLHHARKEGSTRTTHHVAGGMAFSGSVDRVLVLEFHENSKDRRTLEIVKRGRPLPKLLLQWGTDDRLYPEGDVDAVAFDELRQRVLRLMESAHEDGEDWLRKRDIFSRLGEPAPSDRHLRNVLDSLVEDGLLERDPPQDRSGATYRYRLKPNLAQEEGYMPGQVLEPAQPNLAQEGEYMPGQVSPSAVTSSPPENIPLWKYEQEVTADDTT